MMNARSRLSVFLGVTCAVYAGGCAGPGDADTDAGADSSGAAAGSTDATSGASSSGGTGGDESTTDSGTTGDVAPVIELTRLTDPSWEIVDFHQRSAEFGEGYDLWSARTEETLPPPRHIQHPDLGIGPGEAHEGPYDREFSDAWAQHGWSNDSVFTLAEATTPLAIFSMFMVVPSANAPTGKTPDADAGPMIPHTLFPIHTAFEYLTDGTPVLGGVWDFDVPRLDMINPVYEVEGHSHFPIYDARYLDIEPALGEVYETHIVMTDATGSGWDFKYGFVAR